MEIPVDDQTTWWCLKAGRGGVLEDDWIDQDIVTIGWGETGDFRNLGKAEFRDKDPSHNQQLSKFLGYHEKGMRAGDVVVAYAPDKGHVSGVGVVDEPQYNPEQAFRYLTDDEARKAGVQDHYFSRPVSWFDWGTPVAVSDLSKQYQVNGQYQLPTPLTLNQYGSLKTDRDRIETLADEIYNSETVDTSDGGFGPERESEIQDWIVDNIRTLELSNPREEVQSSVGRMDILAESDTGETIIEVKFGRAGDRALGQLLGYMGARSTEIDSSITGIIVAESFTTRVKSAVSVIENVSLYKFKVRSTLEVVDSPSPM
ncbi:endonuclease NucS domain-containing protein [Haladaptatus sp. YSMS36]|uniref:endonuclease NucS domain-containing protein n=1 Tax=Haladaptatus sp. YSMS36 TaxID=3033384 RepID=UPI0023E7D0CA|nr:endonuclease NucS domain-containing protein [Haladaptatus sp. YSMS36]